MKYLKKFENIENPPKFKEGDYVKYLYDMLDTYILEENDFFFVKKRSLGSNKKYYYRLIKIDKDFNLTEILYVNVLEKNLKEYQPTKEERDTVETILNINKYNL